MTVVYNLHVGLYIIYILYFDYCKSGKYMKIYYNVCMCVSMHVCACVDILACANLHSMKSETIIIFVINLPLCQTIHKIDLTFWSLSIFHYVCVCVCLSVCLRVCLHACTSAQLRVLL